MPPPVTTQSNLIVAALTAFRNLVNGIQRTGDPGQQLQQVTTSMGEMVNVLERVATATAEHEQQLGQIDQRFGQNEQQMQNLQQECRLLKLSEQSVVTYTARQGLSKTQVWNHPEITQSELYYESASWA